MFVTDDAGFFGFCTRIGGSGTDLRSKARVCLLHDVSLLKSSVFWGHEAYGMEIARIIVVSRCIEDLILGSIAQVVETSSFGRKSREMLCVIVVLAGNVLLLSEDTRSILST